MVGITRILRRLRRHPRFCRGSTFTCSTEMRRTRRRHLRQRPQLPHSRRRDSEVRKDERKSEPLLHESNGIRMNNPVQCNP